MGEDESLVVVPDFVHLLNKVVRVVSFDNVFSFGGYVEIDELSDVESDFLI